MRKFTFNLLALFMLAFVVLFSNNSLNAQACVAGEYKICVVTGNAPPSNSNPARQDINAWELWNFTTNTMVGMDCGDRQSAFWNGQTPVCANLTDDYRLVTYDGSWFSINWNGGEISVVACDDGSVNACATPAIGVEILAPSVPTGPRTGQQVDKTCPGGNGIYQGEVAGSGWFSGSTYLLSFAAADFCSDVDTVVCQDDLAAAGGVFKATAPSACLTTSDFSDWTLTANSSYDNLCGIFPTNGLHLGTVNGGSTLDAFASSPMYDLSCMTMGGMEGLVCVDVMDWGTNAGICATPTATDEYSLDYSLDGGTTWIAIEADAEYPQDDFAVPNGEANTMCYPLPAAAAVAGVSFRIHHDGRNSTFDDGFFQNFSVTQRVTPVGGVATNLNAVTTGTTLTLASGTLEDSGPGLGDYLANENYDITLCPLTPGNKIEIRTVFVDVEDDFVDGCDDYLRFHNGNSTAASIFAQNNNSTVPALDSWCNENGRVNVNTYNDAANIFPNQVFTSTAANGCLTIAFVSDATEQHDGFEIDWYEITPSVCSWSTISAPAGTTVSYTDPSDPQTDVLGLGTPGTYTLRYSCADGTDDTLVINIYDTNPDAGMDFASCVGAGATLPVTVQLAGNTSPQAASTWTVIGEPSVGAAGAFTPDANTANATFPANATGLYTLEWSWSIGGCTGRDTVVVNVKDLSTLSAGNDTTICFDSVGGGVMLMPMLPGGPSVLASESFATATEIANFPAGWTRFPVTTCPGWVIETTGNNSFGTSPDGGHGGGGTVVSGNPYTLMETSCTPTGDTMYLMSPTVTLPAGAGLSVNFWYHMFGTNMAGIGVDFSDDGGVTWNNMGLEPNPGLQPLGTSPWLQSANYTGAPAGTSVMVRFWGVNLACCSNDIGLDDIEISALASGGWTIVSGGTGTFDPPTGTNVLFTPDTIGLYSLELCITDPDCGVVCDTVEVDVIGGPMVDAGDDETDCAITSFPHTITLGGSPFPGPPAPTPLTTDMAAANGTTVISTTTGTGLLYDSGGPTGQYALNENLTTTLCPVTAGNAITITFTTALDIEERGSGCWDYLLLYDGATTGSPAITNANINPANSFCGDGSSASSAPLVVGSTFTSTDASGCLTLNFNSDGSVVRDGFEISWSEAGFVAPPVTGPSYTGMWSQAAGPDTAVFVDPMDSLSDVSFPSPGCYDLVWEVTQDGFCGNADTVTYCYYFDLDTVFAGNDTVSCDPLPSYTFNATPDSASINASGLVFDTGSGGAGGGLVGGALIPSTTLGGTFFTNNSNTGHSWNVTNTSGVTIQITSLDLVLTGATGSVDIWVNPTGGNAGNATSGVGWTLSENVPGITANQLANATTVTLATPIVIPAGATYGIGFNPIGIFTAYISGAGTPWVTTLYSDANLIITEGAAGGAPGAGLGAFAPRNFGGTITYESLSTAPGGGGTASGPCEWTILTQPMGANLFFNDLNSSELTVLGMTEPGIYTYVWSCDLGPCGFDADTVVIRIAQPTVEPDAGADISVCVDPTMAMVDTIGMDANEITIENPDSVPTYNVMTSGIQEVSDCKGIIYDDGGLTGNYSPSQLTQFTIRVPGATSITLTIDTVGLEAGFDSLRIVDGDNIFLSPLLFNSEPTGTTPAGGLTITSTDSVMSLFFFADPFTEEFGWSMSWVANGIAGCDSISLGYWTIAQAPCGSAVDTADFVAPAELSYIAGSMNPLALVPFDAPGEWILVWNTDSLGCTYSDSVVVNIGAPYGGVLSDQYDTVCTPPNYQFNLGTVDYSADLVKTGPQPDNCAHGNAHVITTGAPNYTIIDLQSFSVTGSYNLTGQPDGEYCAFTLSWLLSDDLSPMGWDVSNVLPPDYAPFIGGSASTLFDLINVDGWCADTSNLDCFVIASPDAGTIAANDTICYDLSVDPTFTAMYNNDGNIPAGFANTFLLIDPTVGPNVVLDEDAGGVLTNPGVANRCYDVWMIVYNTATINPSTDITPGVSTLTDVILLDVNCLAITGPMPVCIDTNFIVNAGDDDTACVASTPASVMLDFQNGDAMNGSWAPAAGVSYADDEDYNTMATFTMPGTYCLTWNEVDTTVACPDASDITCITIVEIPVPDAGPDSTICETNQPYMLSATMTGTWTALNGGTLSSTTDPNATVTDMVGGMTYQFEWVLMDATCGMLRDVVTITVDASNTTDAGPDQQLCEGAPTTTMLAGTGTNGSWNAVAGITYSNQNSATSSITVASAGLYTLVWTEISTNTCPDVSDSVMINVLGVGSVTAGMDATICLDDSYTMTATTTGPATWTVPAGASLSSMTDPLASATFTFPGTYQFTWTLDDMSCGVISDMVVITVDAAPAAPTASANPLTGCITSLPSTTVTGDGNYVWYSDAGLTTLADYSDVSGVDDEMFSPTTVTGGQYDTVWVVSQSTNGCFGPATMIPFWVDSCMAMITDPCACLNNATTTTNGQFSELVEITGPTGQTWTVTAISGYFETTSAAPPAAPTPVTVGTVLVETSPGVYQLPGRHVDAIGFSVSISNGFTTFTQAATCYYPEAMVTNVGTDVCISDPAFALMGSAVLGDGSNTPVTGTATFTVDGIAATMFDPATLGVGPHTVTITFDADSVNPANTGCVQTMDPITVNVNANNTVNAGNDITVCVASLPANIPGLGMGGNGATGSWTGCGTFANVNSSTTFGSGITATGTGTCVLTWTETSTNACPDATDQVTVTVNLIPTVDAGADQTLCVGETATLAATSSTGCGTWTVPAGVTISSTSAANATATAGSGTYMLTWTSCDSTCGIIQDMVTLTFNEPLAGPVTSGGADTVRICVGDGLPDPITYTSATQGGNVTYIITDNLGNILGTGIPNPMDLEGAGGGTCLIWAVSSYGTINIPAVGGSAANITGDCWALSSAPLTIVRNALPVIDAGPDQTLCVGDTAMLAATGTGTWVVPAGITLSSTTDPNATATAGSGTYILTYTVDGMACGIIQDQVTLTFNEPLAGPVTSGGADSITICVGDGLPDPITYTSATQGDNVTYIITDNLGNILGTGIPNPMDLEGAGAGTCLIWAVSSYGAINIPASGPASGITGDCWALSSAPLTIVRNAIPVLDAGVDTVICVNSTYTMAATGTGTWTQTAGPIGSVLPSTDPNAIFTPTVAGTYAYSWSVNDPICGLVSDNMTIVVDDLNSVDAGTNQTICATTLPATGVQLGIGGTGTTGSWSITPGVSYDNPASFGAIATFTAAGSYTLTWTETSTNACPSVSDVVTITIEEQPVVSAGADTSICISAGFYTLDGSGAGIWSVVSGSILPFNVNDPNATIIPTAAGTVVLERCTTTVICGTVCDMVTVVFDNTNTVDAGMDETYCANGISTIAIGTSGTGVTGMWTSSPTGVTFGTGFNTNATFPTNGVYTLTWTETSMNACPNATDDIVVTINAGPQLSISGGLVICPTGLGNPASTTLTVNGAGPGATYQWNNGSFTNTSTFSAAGTAKVVVTTIDGCIDSIEVTIIEDCNPAPQTGSSTIIGITWCESDSNGVYNAGTATDTILNGVLVLLIDCTDSSVVASTSTMGMGNYQFNNVDPGNYSLIFIDTANNKPTTLYTGGRTTTSNDADPTGRTLLPCLTVGPGDTLAPILGGNAGFYEDEPLNVDLVSYAGTSEACAVTLDWTTATESDLALFLVERSTDGINYEQIGVVAATGNSTVNQEYQLIDNAPSNGINYYRLVQVTQDGTSEIIGLIDVNVNCSIIEITNLYPNPAVNDVNIVITSGEEGPVTIEMIDMLGRTLYSNSEELAVGENVFSLDISGLAAAPYFIGVKNVQGETVTYIKFVKTNE